jgi:hypothetical protein
MGGALLVDGERKSLRPNSSARARTGGLTELLEDPEAPALIHVPGQRLGLPAVPGEPVFEPPGLITRVGEDEDAAPALAPQEPQEQAELLLAPHVVEDLLGLLHRLPLWRDRDLDRVVHELPGQLQDAERQRGREQEGLPLLRWGQPPQDEAQVGDEAHVENPVGLVDDIARPWVGTVSHG